MRVLMISKACLVGAYQTKPELIASHDGVELLLVVPPVWLDPAGPVELERRHTDGYQLLVDKIRFNGNYHFYYFQNLKRHLANFKPDILHIDEEPYNLATWLAWRQASAAGVKSLFFTWQNINRSYPIPFRWMESQVLQGVDYAIMGNHAAVDVFQNKGYGGHFSVIPQFGVDPDRFHPLEEKDSGRTFTIGSANRRLVPEKGLDVLLRAVVELPGIWRLHIAGEGPSKQSLIRLTEDLGIADRVHFDGIVGSDQMPAYVRNLDVLVLSSLTMPNWKEQFGRVLVEAMSSRVAVVGSDSGEIPRVMGSAGLVYPEADHEALRDRLMQLLQSPELRRELGDIGRQRVLDNYTQEQIAAQTVAVYEEMMST